MGEKITLTAADIKAAFEKLDSYRGAPPYYLFVRDPVELKAALNVYGDCSDVYIIDKKENVYHQRQIIGKLSEIRGEKRCVNSEI